MKKEFIEGVKALCAAEENVPLSKMTSFGIGGNAALLASPENETELWEIFRLIRAFDEKYTVLGNMTNILAPDEGYGGIIISARGLDDISFDGIRGFAGAGTGLTGLALSAAKKGLSGLEFAFGIPGSVGGGIYMNAGAYGGEMADIVSSVRVYSPEKDEFIEYSAEECKFGKRRSRFCGSGEIIVSAAFSLTHGDENEISDKMNENMKSRREKQPLEYPSAGSVFKRPEGYFAGALIEGAGLKGCRIGGAQVSELHAGFIINAGGATERDVKTLIEHITATVYEKYGVTLEREIIYMDRE